MEEERVTPDKTLSAMYRIMNLKEELTPLEKQKLISEFTKEGTICIEEYATNLISVLLDENQQLKAVISKIEEYVNHPDFIDWHIGVDEGIFRRDDILSIIKEQVTEVTRGEGN